MMSTDKNNYFIDSDGQYSIIEEEIENYFPVAYDYKKIPNRLISRYGSISYLANLGLFAGISVIQERSRKDYEGTELGQFYNKIYKETGTDYSDGLISCIPVSSLIALYGLSSNGHTYNTLDALYNSHIMENQWSIYYKDQDIIAYTHVITGTMYNKKEGKLYIKFNSDLKEVLVNIQKDYTRIALPLLGKTKTSEVTLLYSNLKSWYDAGIGKARKYGDIAPDEIQHEVKLSELRFMLGMYPMRPDVNDPDMLRIEKILANKDFDGAAKAMENLGLIDRYLNDKAVRNCLLDYKAFKRGVLDKSFRRINGFTAPKKLENARAEATGDKAYEQYARECSTHFPTDIHFRYSAVGHGKGGKVDSVIFYISSAARYTDVDTVVNEEHPVRTSETKPDMSIKAAVNEDQLLEFIDQLRDLFTEKLPSKDLKTIALKADLNINRIDKAYRVAKEKPRENLVGFMLKAIEDGYEPAVSTSTRKKTANQFADFPQRQYSKEDYEEMERKMMNR